MYVHLTMAVFNIIFISFKKKKKTDEFSLRQLGMYINFNNNVLQI